MGLNWCLFLLLVAYAGGSTGVAATPPALPGRCPPVRGFGSCVEHCLNCTGRGMLCCSNGCGHVCMKPVPSGRPSYCYLPAVLGLCKDYMSSWFYNARTGLCTKFIYGGCGGNKNRFSSELRCKVTCRARGRPCRSLVCTHYCNYGFKRNKYGCRICSCRSPPPGITTA